jgi:hypothetical protein
VAFDHLVSGYLRQRADTPERLNALLEHDPRFALAHCGTCKAVKTCARAAGVAYKALWR